MIGRRARGEKQGSGFVRQARGVLTLFILLSTGIAAAQDVRVQVARGPYYLGQPFELQVAVNDFEEEPTPVVEAPEIDGGRLRYVGVSPSTSTSISIVNGKMSRTREVKFIFRYELLPLRRGVLRVPEFEVSQGTISRQSRGIQLEVAAVPRNDGIALSLEVPEGPIFVGQKVPIAIEFRLDLDTRRDLVNYSIEVPLFNLPSLRFMDAPLADADTNLVIETNAGTLRLPAVSKEMRIGGREVLVVRAERTLIALSDEPIQADAASVFVEQGTRYRQDLFNQRHATASQKFMATDRPVEIEVADVPRAGRPPSFAGAIGEGFTLEVTADRSVVQIGEPIQLNFHLRGNGDLTSARLPELDAEGLFDPNLFRLPEEPPAGIVDEDGKHFEATLRVLDAEVREIPALSYSWFDAESRAFETTHSRPIALSVGAAEIIGADAVTRRAADGADGNDIRVGSAGEGAAGGPESEKQSSLVQNGANLAVERNLDVLLSSGTSGPRIVQGIIPVLYGVGVALLLFAFWENRRKNADPNVAARKRAFANAQKAIKAAGKLPAVEGGASLGRVLRELIAEFPEEAGPDLDVLLQECDALRFAPDASGSGGRASELLERARVLLAARASSDAAPEKGAQ